MEPLRKSDIKHTISENYKSRMTKHDFLMWYEFDLMLRRYVEEVHKRHPEVIPEDFEDKPYFKLIFEIQDAQLIQIKDSYYYRSHVFFKRDRGYIAVCDIDFYINPLLLMPQGFELEEGWKGKGLDICTDDTDLLPEISIKLTNDIVKTPKSKFHINQYNTYSKYEIPTSDLSGLINEKFCDVGTYRPRICRFESIANPVIIKEVGKNIEDFSELTIGDKPWDFSQEPFGIAGTQFYDKNLDLYKEPFMCFLFAQLDNKYDDYAIQIYRWNPITSVHAPYAEFTMIGYVPRGQNRMMHETMCSTNNRLLFAYQDKGRVYVLGAISEFSRIVSERSEELPFLEGVTIPYELFQLLR